MPSPLFTIGGLAPGAPAVTTHGTTGHFFELFDRTGVNSVLWEWFGRNSEDIDYPELVISEQGFRAEFDIPFLDGTGLALGIRCTINRGVIPGTNTPDPDLTTTSGIYVPATNGFIPVFVGETYEYDSVSGWGARINAALASL